MRKIVFNILATVGLGFGAVSCDFDQYSPNSIPFDQGFKNLGSIQSLELGAYSRLRTAISPYSMTLPDLQADYMHAVFGYANIYGEVYQWTFKQDDSDIEAAWQDLYACIGQNNFILDGIDEATAADDGRFSQSDLSELDLIKGRMYLMRALCYSILAERFCADYDAATASAENSGLPLIVKYDPDEKPSRATLEKVYEQIDDDLTEARRYLANVKGSANATTLNIDCVTALEARVLLQTDHFPEALEKANSLIGNTAYSLITSQEELQEMWTYDKSPETIFQFYASKTELAYAWGKYFYSDYYNGQQSNMRLMYPDYIPTTECVAKFEDGDWRRQVYFFDCSMNKPIDGVYYYPLIKGHSAYALSGLTIVSKYPGNPDLRTSSTWNYYNSFKVFRLAEMYLIAAEAAVQSNGDAATPLNELRKWRGLTTPLENVTLEDVQNERYREMMMEGTRLTDLKRWGLDMKRNGAQSGILQNMENGKAEEGSYITEVNANIEVAKTDYRFVWPIPASEIFANGNLKQNSGWER